MIFDKKADGLVAVFISALCVGYVNELTAAETAIGEHVFTHPDNLEVIRVAGPPLIDRPIEISFDEQGRLYCTDSAGVNDPVQQQLEEKPHQIVRLEDTDGDGVFDERVIFAEGMMFPEGCLWYAGSLYVAAPPSIWKLTDTDGDGRADQREEWFQGKTLTGCANDLHGPYLGLDGRIYWTKGAFAEQTYDRSEQAPWVTRAAHIFRARPNGQDIEPVMTGGMDNPVGVTFTPGGERIFTTTFLQHPGGGNRDGLIHAVYGGVYGKDHGVIEGHPRTGELMPVLTHLGAAAPAGLARYRSAVFGEDYRDNLFSALFNRQQIVRHQLSPRGASFESTDEVFLQSNNRNFHPTDVDEDADGSLLVVDTGGWYKLCCPTSQLPKPDVLGGIYRIRPLDTPRMSSPRGKELGIESMDLHEVVQRMNDPRPAVGDQLIARLGNGSDASIKAIEEIGVSSLDEIGQRRLVWALARLDSVKARELTRPFLRASDSLVRLAAIHSTSLHRDTGAMSELLRLLSTDVIGNRRATAEALGRLEEARAIPDLLAQLAQAHDRVFEHSLIYALIEIGSPDQVAAGLDSQNELVHLGALVALDQMKSESVGGEHLVRALRGDRESTRRKARWILGNRPDLGTALLPVLRSWLLDPSESGLDSGELADLFAKLSANPSVADLLGELLTDVNSTTDAKRLILGMMIRSDDPAAVDSWTTGIVALIQSRDTDLLNEATRAAAHLANDKIDRRSLLKELMRLSVDMSVNLKERLVAVGVLVKHLETLQNVQFTAMIDGLRLEQPVHVRSLASAAIQQASLNNQQLVMLARALKQVGPLEVGACLQPFSKSQQARVGTTLISGLQASPGLSSVTPALLKHTFKGYPEAVRSEVEALMQRIDVGLEAKQERLSALLHELPEGDVRRGQAIFNSEKAACFSCHEIGYLGGNVGPDLTRIGRVRSREDLLEAIVFPSMSFVRSYEPYHLTTHEGDQHSGIIRNDDGATLTIVTGPGQEMKVGRDAVFELNRSQTSLMPGGMSEILSPIELADLLAFLEATKR
jgi:putative membrane-bound dehydrogenase-like protein